MHGDAFSQCWLCALQAAQAYNNEPYFTGQQVYGTDKLGNLLTSFGYYPDFTKASLAQLLILNSCMHACKEAGGTGSAMQQADGALG